MSKQKVKELRLVVTTEDFDNALAFYRDKLGLQQQDAVPPDSGRVAILEAGRATLELVEPETAAFIDRIEVGERVSGWIRVAFEVEDVVQTTDTLTASGAALLGAPKPTPFRSINSRLDAPAGLQLTLFQRQQ
ncbi:VOC family protein [Pectobacterium brasiliense]|uniref:VOC family protein n=1 Tax=Pectobacterium TaxID=122277 RepID=UPI001CE02B4A|nr:MULTISPECIES: VOC family protein [Pectobacterium]MCA5919723.1 VOC family protein [Pectobacterium brasiliense]MCA5929026.1 VOC family protein [Pectobacterium brasiliense]MCA5935274.1 VOC family protein [Pectobacterium brasiliense]MCA5938831.1 VOC family protein [Pectobacterium brasiliense]MCA5943123.1 VOC family protein [Pectobacterium brasiliense]